VEPRITTSIPLYSGCAVRRSFLMLQGPATPFFSRLSARLLSDRHKVYQICFCAGDVFFGTKSEKKWFQGPVEGLAENLTNIYEKCEITDQILFGDCRPIHRVAVEKGAAHNLRTNVYEEGYFRPNLITLEQGGVNSNSMLPRDPDWFFNVGERLPEGERVIEFSSPFSTRAFYDVLYHVAGIANPFLFSKYRTHVGFSAPIEYASYVARFSKLQLIRNRDRAKAAEISTAGTPYYLFPLQLNHDAQIRSHSRFEHMGEAIYYVLKSFSKSAPKECKIVIKNHPLDPGLMNYKRVIRSCEGEFDIYDRVEYLEDGDLHALVSNSIGVVTVNSTVGSLSLECGVPTFCIADPIYNLPGLTCQMSLEEFWQRAVPPNAELFERFKRVVTYATQVNGGFYSSAGMTLAVDNSVHVLCADQSPLESLL
jgi:capsular polysaccharide export protein